MLLSVVNILFCPVILPLNVQGTTGVAETLCAHTPTHDNVCLETSIIHSLFPITEGWKARQCCFPGMSERQGKTLNNSQSKWIKTAIINIFGDIKAYFPLNICFHFKLGAVRKATHRLQCVVLGSFHNLAYVWPWLWYVGQWVEVLCLLSKMIRQTCTVILSECIYSDEDLCLW